YWFRMVLGDMLNLPFPEGCFDRVVSVTTLEFIEDAKRAINELFRVTRKGGCIVAATLNSLSPWAISRKAEAKKKRTIFKKAIFRSPDQLRALVPLEGIVQTAIHFQKEDRPDIAPEIEDEGRKRERDTGALVAARWIKP
ncbi:MAG: methyltransferase domain-containing protein, partial [Thermodesulfobacteriota bacterium]|nr:methyltransferase domain-containing protein [Thermodesulfobacteriota bacterium]